LQDPLGEFEPDAPIVAGDIASSWPRICSLHFFDLATGQAIRDDG